ncbi:thiamine transporter YuaJ [Gottschalkia purinilytica]|uniref:Thiamine transporter YuaJ n=1 Tax=Gottschalkia purinilytica TaxID=1503 RepID=A0A0L0WB69_GOTPU|nr:energy-coupled thiamine transporter ThiT [Gottschalkia purinilytica]KNF08748.1 thiamine transporter YuaJ [Gottschalkia purinilytica]
MNIKTSETNKSTNIKFLVEAGVMVALATILSMVKIYQAPNGGSVTAGSMIPIIFIALRWGVLRGIFTGLVYGLVQSFDPYIVHPIQYILDYLVAFSFLGLAGIAKNIIATKNKKDTAFEYVVIIVGVFLGILGRFICHVLSGVIFFEANAKDLGVWKYSIIYNGTYLGIELIMSILILTLIWRPLRRLLSS